MLRDPYVRPRPFYTSHLGCHVPPGFNSTKNLADHLLSQHCLPPTAATPSTNTSASPSATDRPLALLGPSTHPDPDPDPTLLALLGPSSTVEDDGLTAAADALALY